MPAVGRGATLLGYAGLLPQAVALLLVALGRRSPSDQGGILLVLGYALALAYAAIILSFLGGIWWGIAMRREERQLRLAAIAVLPSLVGLACIIAAGLSMPGGQAWPAVAVALGSAVMLTLLVDRHLVRTGEAPANWMRLRTPLSIGLGMSTIAAGALTSQP